MTDYREFIRALEGKSGRASIFEPFPNRKIVTQLIWRAGEFLWDTTEHKVATLIDFYAYIKSDVAVIDTRGDDIERILACDTLLPDGMKFVIISDDADVLCRADVSDAVCALAVFEGGVEKYTKPMIYLCGGDIEKSIKSAVGCGCKGIYIPTGAEEYIEAARGKITLIGGLGLDYINSAEPLEIHARVKTLFDGGNWMVGSGIFGETTEYLGFISMLGIYNHLI
ncbi:MAG: hypothetical protein HFE63_09975 [Clostridiales bacterium]|nr:hypothetical protein [Clostridiales bacterium]